MKFYSMKAVGRHDDYSVCVFVVCVCVLYANVHQCLCVVHATFVWACVYARFVLEIKILSKHLREF